MSKAIKPGKPTHRVDVKHIQPRYIMGVDELRRPVAIQELATHIRENGMLLPIIVDSDMGLISGWRRLEAWKMQAKPGDLVPIIRGSWIQMLTALEHEVQADPCPEMRVPMTFSEGFRYGVLIDSIYQQQAAASRGGKLTAEEFGGKTGYEVRNRVGAILGHSPEHWDAMRCIRVAYDPGLEGSKSRFGHIHSGKLAREAVRRIEEDGWAPRRASDFYFATLRAQDAGEKVAKIPPTKRVLKWEQTVPALLMALETVERNVAALGPIPQDLDPEMAQEWGQLLADRSWPARKLGIALRKHAQTKIDESRQEEDTNG